ncbi:hypothetical protein [Campylobacter sp. US33a]|uniref:hypothetical protein n=1 Tax=Campylobacter sp. US33a TaxID=2498120 RepID=UPI001067457C|nr:hypothetical protein [Campylobacter sp. US33a]TEY01257.1 hypothetical protein ELQ16_07815 [Campylobacter sp. US33a]
MIKGTKADYSRSLFELRGTGIYRIDRGEGEFVDVLKGVFPDYIVRKIIRFHLRRKLNKSA